MSYIDQNLKLMATALGLGALAAGLDFYLQSYIAIVVTTVTIVALAYIDLRSNLELPLLGS